MKQKVIIPSKNNKPFELINIKRDVKDFVLFHINSVKCQCAEKVLKEAINNEEKNVQFVTEILGCCHWIVLREKVDLT